MIENTSGNINTQYLPSTFTDKSGNLTVSAQKAKDVSFSIEMRARSLPEVERGLFLALLKMPNFVPPSKMSHEKIGDSLVKFENAARLLADESGSVDNAKALARALIELASLGRKDALNARLSARTEAKAALEGQAGKLKESASELMRGAVTSLILTVVSSAITIVASTIAIGRTGKGLSDFNSANINSAELQAIGGQASSIGALGNGAAGLASGAGNFASTHSQAASKVIEAEGSILAAEAETIRSDGDVRREQEQALFETIKNTIAFIKEMRDADVEQMRAITSG